VLHPVPLVPYLTADEAATGSILVVYTETSNDNQRPHSEHVQALRTELETAGMPLPDAWMVTSEAWKNYLRTDTSCCPDEPLDVITISNANAAMIYPGEQRHRIHRTGVIHRERGSTRSHRGSQARAADDHLVRTHYAD
jgi:hypothetical protein